MASLAFDQENDAASVLKKLKDKPKEGAALLSKVSNIKITPKDVKKGAEPAFKAMSKVQASAEAGAEPSESDLDDLKDAPEIEQKVEKPWSEDSKKKVFMALSASLPIIIGGAFGGAEGASLGAKTGAGILGEMGRKEEEAAAQEAARQAKATEAEKERELKRELQGEKNQALMAQIALGSGDRDLKSALLAQTLSDKKRMEKESEEKKLFDKSVEGRKQKLGADAKQRLDNATLALQAVQDMATALEGGSSTFSLVGDNPFTLASSLYEEALGRMQSGGAITADEKKNFMNLRPRVTDSKEIQRTKLLKLQAEMEKRIGTLGFKPEELNIKKTNITYGSQNSEPDFDNMSKEELEAFLEQ